MSNYTDKELLMLAAKAYGVEVDYRHGSGAFYYDDESTGREEWEPLDNDGQALRLAVKLQFDVIPKWGDNCVCIIGGGDHFEEPQAPDIYAAMRRAIVRAAAAIGEKL